MTTYIPAVLMAAIDETGRIKTPDLFAYAVTKGFIFDTSGSDKARGKRLARLLRKWNIRPQTMRFPDTIANGYYKSQFAWVIRTEEPLPHDFIC